MKRFFIALVMTLGMGGLVVSTPAPASAINVFKNCNDGVVCQEANGKGGSVSSLVQNLINALLVILGAISVIMIIVGGLRYVLSGGDSNAVSGAKNTILYAVIGLVVALLSYGIVNFIVGFF